MNTPHIPHPAPPTPLTPLVARATPRPRAEITRDIAATEARLRRHEQALRLLARMLDDGLCRPDRARLQERVGHHIECKAILDRYLGGLRAEWLGSWR